MRWLYKLPLRLRSLLSRTRVEQELGDELRFHLEKSIEDAVANGKSPEEARYAALRELGAVEQIKEECRDMRSVNYIENFLQDLRYGVRQLTRNPGFTAAAVLTLALGIGANTAVFSVVNAVLLRALPYREPDRIAVLWATNTLNGSREVNTSVPNFEDWKKRTRTFESLASYRESDASFTVNGEPGWIEYAWVYGDFFRLLGRSPALGRVFSGDDTNPHQVVLSGALWRSRFGASPNVIGRTVTLSGIDFQIIGVMPEGFAFPSNETQLWVPAAALPDWPKRRAERGSGFGPVLARLRPGATLAQAQSEMELINRQLTAEYPKENEDRGVRAVPLAAQIHGKTVPFMLAVLCGAIFLVLLIACANTANLLLARGAVRRREVAMRVALGAGRGRILRQLVTESVLLSGVAGALGLPFAAWSIQALVALAPQGVARLDEAHVDAPVLAFTVGLSLATGLLFGLAPAWPISNVSSGRETAGVDSRGMRRAFVVAEVALAVVLLAGAGLLIRSFVALEAVNPGFQTSRVLTATLRFSNTLPRDQRAELYRQAMARIGQLPGVRAAGAISTMFYMGEDAKFGLRAVEGRPPESREQWTPMTWSTISGDYFQALGVALMRGRFFNDGDTKATAPVVIINETMARRYWPGDDPIGRGIKGFDPRGHNDEWVRVVGVVKDMHSGGLERSPMGQIYEAQAQSLDETENVVVKADVTAEPLRRTIRSIDKTAVLMDAATLQDKLREQSAPRRFQTLLLSIFSALALAMAAAGIFAMMHYSVSQRTQEIGIRMALGAREADVVRMILGEGLLLAGAGVLIGLAGSLALVRSIRSLLFEVGPGDPITLVSVSFVLASAALLACYLPARRATKVDPMVALRYE